MSVGTIRIIAYILMGIVTYLVARLVYAIAGNSDKISAQALKRLQESMDNTSSFYFSPKRITKFMSKYGYMYRHKDYQIEPSTFIMSKFLTAGVGAVAGFVMHMLLAQLNKGLSGFIFTLLFIVVGTIIGFFFPDINTKLENSEDDAKILKDIQNIFGYMQIYAKSNVYLTEMISNCYENTKNPRLKAALKELLNNLMSNTMTPQEAIDVFDSRFANKYIDNLCLILKQSLETSRSANMLENVSEYINSIQKAIDIKKKNRVDTVLALCTVALFAIIISISVYAPMTSMAAF